MTSSFRKPDVHGIITTLSQADLPEFVWNLVVLDRNGDEKGGSVTSRLIAPDGRAVGEPRPLFDLTGEDANEILTSWGRIPIAAAVKTTGVYRGEVLLDDQVIAISRIRIDPPPQRV